MNHHRVLLDASQQLVCYPCYVTHHINEPAQFVEVGTMCCLHASDQISDESLLSGNRGVFPSQVTQLSAVGESPHHRSYQEENPSPNTTSSKAI